MKLDPNTMTVMVGVHALLCLAFLLIIWLFFPRKIRGLNQWIAASSFMVLGGILHGIKEEYSSGILIVMANVAMVAAMLMFLASLQRFYQKPPVANSLVLLILSFVAVIIGWFTWHDSFHNRMVFMTAVQSVLYVYLLVFVYRCGKKGFGHWLILVTYFCASCIALVRLGTLLVVPEPMKNIYDASIIQLLYLSSFSFIWLLTTMGFVAMIIEELQSKLLYLANHDVLTGVLNRGAFFREAQEKLEHARQQGLSFTALLMDMDYFKDINDRLGHKEGDRVLQVFADCASKVFGPKVLFGRYGGEEFVALTSGLSLQQSLDLAESVRQTVKEMLRNWNVTVSIGVAHATEADNVDELLVQADQALYQAKNSGRNKVVQAAAL